MLKTFCALKTYHAWVFLGYVGNEHISAMLLSLTVNNRDNFTFGLLEQQKYFCDPAPGQGSAQTVATWGHFHVSMFLTSLKAIICYDHFYSSAQSELSYVSFSCLFSVLCQTLTVPFWVCNSTNFDKVPSTTDWHAAWYHDAVVPLSWLPQLMILTMIWNKKVKFGSITP